MKSPRLLSLLVVLLCLSGCSRRSTTISDIDSSLTAQFEQQWQQKKDDLDKRVIRNVQIKKFYKPSGSDFFYVEIEVLTDDKRIITGSPIVPLGNSSIGISFEMPDTKQNLNAIISVNP